MFFARRITTLLCMARKSMQDSLGCVCVHLFSNIIYTQRYCQPFFSNLHSQKKIAHSTNPLEKVFKTRDLKSKREKLPTEKHGDKWNVHMDLTRGEIGKLSHTEKNKIYEK